MKAGHAGPDSLRCARAFLVLVLVGLVAAVAGCGSTAATAPSDQPALQADLPKIHRADLPPQARRTLRLIARGGPFPYDKDGAVFENREQLLPARRHGYYHEYTVRTPGENDRGARRIVAGKRERYYTSDHYASFRRIVR